MRGRFLTATAPVLVAGLLAAGPAAAARDTVLFSSVNAVCPGFSKPVAVYAGHGSQADLLLAARWSSRPDGRTGVRTTTLRARGADGAGVRFTVSASFALAEGPGSYGGSFGTGPVRIVRADGAALRGRGSFVLGGVTLGMPTVRLARGTCAR